ncbi:hypothetical protein Pan153_15550 [Gimesia panareensis]|uniref:Uncharacterized protein n=1 Tax=Gimesia panareensis TaxID=2527978 RepID=A0A518FKQ2_9PLAN|nr:hypothetical protein [Gimesia panareensis]QDV16921.1 hypothetical protein Pan153_15550 [Gimesia panareensis]
MKLPDLNLREFRIWFLMAVSVAVCLPLAEWLSLSEDGDAVYLYVSFMYYIAFLVAVVILPVFLVRLCLKRTRPRALAWLLVIGVYLPCFSVGVHLAKQYWTAGWEAFSERSQPLIAAIREYERDQGKPPETLADLVPDYLPAVPDTGIGACSEYQYFTGKRAQNEFEGNPWVLQVIPPVAGIGFDLVLYFPQQNYPKRVYGGSLERVGDWAYLHE